MKYVYDGQGSLFGASRAIGFADGDGFCVKEIDRDLANKVIKENHYSGKFYNATYIHLGVFRGDDLMGVLQFGYAMNPASQGSVVEGTEIDEYLELNRMWLHDDMPRNSESRAIAFAIKVIRASYPRIKWVQSFADERCGLGGVVYQACNFGYYGEHDAVFWTLDGEVYHNSLMTRDPKLSRSAAHLQENKARATSKKLRQFRYLYFMKPRFSKRCLLKRQPYPKLNATRPDDEQAPSLCEAGGTPAGRSKGGQRGADTPRALTTTPSDQGGSGADVSTQPCVGERHEWQAVSG